MALQLRLIFGRKELERPDCHHGLYVFYEKYEIKNQISIPCSRLGSASRYVSLFSFFVSNKIYIMHQLCILILSSPFTYFLHFSFFCFIIRSNRTVIFSYNIKTDSLLFLSLSLNVICNDWSQMCIYVPYSCCEFFQPTTSIMLDILCRQKNQIFYDRGKIEIMCKRWNCTRCRGTT